MDQNPDSREAIPPVGLSRMVIGRLEPHFPTSTGNWLTKFIVSPDLLTAVRFILSFGAQRYS